MFKKLGISTALVSLGALISSFGAFHMLINISDADQELITANLGYCHGMYRAGANNSVHLLTSVELISIKWTLVLTICYTFLTMVMIRAELLNQFKINFIISNAMMMVGIILMLLLFVSSITFYETMPFTETWCNDLVVGLTYIIGVDISVAIVFYLLQSCEYYLQIEPANCPVCLSYYNRI